MFGPGTTQRVGRFLPESVDALYALLCVSETFHSSIKPSITVYFTTINDHNNIMYTFIPHPRTPNIRHQSSASS